jgi:hypothetical protein
MKSEKNISSSSQSSSSSSQSPSSTNNYDQCSPKKSDFIHTSVSVNTNSELLGILKYIVIIH